MDLIDKGSHGNGYVLPTFQVRHHQKELVHVQAANIQSPKNFKNVPIRMKALLMFPEDCFQIKNIESICDSLSIIYSTTWSANEALNSLKIYAYDILIIDRRRYDSNNLDVDKFASNIKKDFKNPSVKIISFCDKFSEDYSILHEKGYDEQWINYDDNYALKNYLSSFMSNQFVTSYQITRTSILQNVFDNLIEGVEILDHDFNIETGNIAFQKMFNERPENIIGMNWFKFHRIQPTTMKAIVSDLNTNTKWDGLISNQNVDKTSNYNVMIRFLNFPKRHYIVHINTATTSQSGIEHSLSISSHDKESTNISYTKTKDTFLNHSQIAIESPILKVMKIINNVQSLTTPIVNNQLQNIVEILSSKDLFITTVESLKTDKMSSSFIDGLLSNNATIFAQTETRRHSSSLVKTKISKIPEIPENEEVGAIDELLEHFQEWSFDILKLESLSEFKPLRLLGMKIFNRFDIGSTLNIDSKHFENWLYVIESNYNDSNTYHNSTHAADVLQSSAWFLERKKVNEIFDSYDDAISIIAAIIHDLGHPGRTNPFLINSNHNLAVLYNDIAVLENHHVSFAFKLTLKDDRINIFKNLNSDDYRSMRHGVIDAVLATEMAKHFEHLTKFVNNILKGNDVHQYSTSEMSNEETKDVTQDIENLSQPENKAIIRRMLIKCSDVNNPTRPFNLCQEWAKRISEEYFNQTDDEIMRNIPVVMPQFNRKTCDISESQITFIDLFLEDMFGVWNNFVDADELIHNLHENKIRWRATSRKPSEDAEKANDEL